MPRKRCDCLTRMLWAGHRLRAWHHHAVCSTLLRSCATFASGDSRLATHPGPRIKPRRPTCLPASCTWASTSAGVPWTSVVFSPIPPIRHFPVLVSHLGQGRAGLAIMIVDCLDRVVKHLVEHDLPAVEMQDIEPGAVSDSLQNGQVIRFRKLRILRPCQGTLAGRLAGKEEAVGASGNRLGGEAPGRGGNDLQAGMHGSRGLAQVGKQLFETRELEGRRKRAEHRLNERNTRAHLRQGDPLGLQDDKVFPFRAAQGPQPAPILGPVDRIRGLHRRLLAAADIQGDAPVHNRIQSVRSELDEVEVEFLLKFQRQLGQTPGGAS